MESCACYQIIGLSSSIIYVYPNLWDLCWSVVKKFVACFNAKYGFAPLKNHYIYLTDLSFCAVSLYLALADAEAQAQLGIAISISVFNIDCHSLVFICVLFIFWWLFMGNLFILILFYDIVVNKISLQLLIIMQLLLLLEI